MLRFLKAIRDDQDGASAVEYALLIALISVLIYGGAVLIGTSTSSTFQSVADSL